VAILVVEAGVRASPEPLPYRRLPVATSTTAAEVRPRTGSLRSGPRTVVSAFPVGAGRPVVAVPPSPASTEAAPGRASGPRGEVPGRVTRVTCGDPGRFERVRRAGAAATTRVRRGRTASAARVIRGRTAPAIRTTCGLAARQGLSSGTTTSPFRDHTPA